MNKILAANDPKVLEFMRKVNCNLSSGKKENDPTIDQEIARNGGIKSPIDNKIYNNKKDYLSHIKDSGCHIKDY